MLNISELHLASIIMDLAAVFILVGMIVYTSVYRRRGHFDDKIFFHLIVITVIMAVSDGITYVLDGSTLRNSALISLIFNNIFFITFELFAGLVAVYMDYRVLEDKGKIVRRGAFIMIPALVTIVMILINNFAGFLFGVNFDTNEYFEYTAYPLIFLAPLLYIIISVIKVAKIKASVLWLMVLLIMVRVISRFLLQGVSSTPVIFAMGLVFIHLIEMKKPFYGEEAK